MFVGRSRERPPAAHLVEISRKTAKTVRGVAGQPEQEEPLRQAPGAVPAARRARRQEHLPREGARPPSVLPRRRCGAEGGGGRGEGGEETPKRRFNLKHYGMNFVKFFLVVWHSKTKSSTLLRIFYCIPDYNYRGGGLEKTQF